VDEELNMTWRSVLAAQKANQTLGCVKRREASKSKEVILPLCCALMTPHPES